MSEIMNLWHSITGIVTSSDIVTLIIMAVVAIGAGFAMQGMGSIVTATFGALVLFGLANFVRGAIAGKSATTLALTDWHNLLAMQVQLLMAYAIAFAIVIAIVHTVRSIVMR
jgi:hypothetical protein